MQMTYSQEKYKITYVVLLPKCINSNESKKSSKPIEDNSNILVCEILQKNLIPMKNGEKKPIRSWKLREA